MRTLFVMSTILSNLALVGCTSAKVATDDGTCPEGQEVNADGNCVDSQSDDDGGGDDGGATDSGGGDGTDSGSSDDCTAEFDQSEPADGDSDFYFRGTLHFVLDDDDPDATATLFGADGSVISGASTYDADDTTVTFAPDNALTPSSDYTATLSWCDGEETISFSTSELGTPLEDDNIAGNTYLLDMESARWVKPEGAGAILSGQLTSTLMLGVESADTELVLNGTATDPADPAQDYCAETVSFPPADFSGSPYFQVGPDTITLSLGGVDLQLTDFEFSGTFASDGNSIDGGRMVGAIDVRDIAFLLESILGTDDPAAVCMALASFGVECEECADGEDLCLAVELDQVNAPLVDGLTLESIDQSDCHPECAASADNPDCDTSGW